MRTAHFSSSRAGGSGQPPGGQPPQKQISLEADPLDADLLDADPPEADPPGRQITLWRQTSFLWRLVMWTVMHAGKPTPTVNRMTHRCKNITLPQTSFAGGN